MGSSLDSKALDVEAIFFTCKRTCKQLLGGDTEEVGNGISIDRYRYTVVRSGTDGNFSGIFQNQVSIDAVTLCLLDRVLTGNLCDLCIGQRVRTPEIVIVTATAEESRRAEHQQTA